FLLSLLPAVVNCLYHVFVFVLLFFFFQAEDGIRDFHVTGVQTCALPILPPSSISSLPPDIASQTVELGSRSSCSWSTYAICTVSPTESVPLSGCSRPRIIRNRVVFPAPLGPIMPTIPAGGSENVRFSYNNLSPNALETPFASMTLLPSRGPGGMKSSSFSSRSFAS